MRLCQHQKANEDPRGTWIRYCSLSKYHAPFVVPSVRRPSIRGVPQQGLQFFAAFHIALSTTISILRPLIPCKASSRQARMLNDSTGSKYPTGRSTGPKSRTKSLILFLNFWYPTPPQERKCLATSYPRSPNS